MAWRCDNNGCDDNDVAISKAASASQQKQHSGAWRAIGAAGVANDMARQAYEMAAAAKKHHKCRHQ